MGWERKEVARLEQQLDPRSPAATTHPPQTPAGRTETERLGGIPQRLWARRKIPLQLRRTRSQGHFSKC
jgi:hypothetical protein